LAKNGGLSCLYQVEVGYTFCMDIIFIAVGFVVLGGLLVVAAPFIKKLMNEDKREIELPFKLKNNFFTSSEWNFFKILEEKIDHTKYTVFPKVRMEDFIEPTNSGKGKFASRNRIKSRHVDFLVWDIENSSIAFAIELDGKSHNSQKAIEADKFKDDVYRTIGLQLHRVQVGSDFATEITKILP
jgi:very-short-patch-repair endonuclease